MLMRFSGYMGIIIGNPVERGASVCGLPSPLPMECSTATGGGVVRRAYQIEGEDA